MASTGDIAKLHSIINGWPTVEQEREKEEILSRLSRKSSKKLATESDPYGAEEIEEVEEEEEEDQHGDLRDLPTFSAFPKLRPTSAKIGSLTPCTSVGESLASFGSFSPCSSVGERLNELDQSHLCSNSSTSAPGDSESSSSGRSTVYYVNGKFVRKTI